MQFMILQPINSRKTDLLIFFSMVVMVFLTRLPFLSAGYGNDPDSWRVAAVAHRLATTGEYRVSRLPGHPVQEIVSSFVWQGGPIVLNAVTALLGAVAVAFFALSARRVRCQHYVLASVSLAFVPVVYIASTSTLDFVWALAFIMGALYFVLSSKPLAAGGLLGIAIGCRLTSGAMLIPLGYLLVRSQANTTEENLRNLVKLVIATCTVGVILYLPPFLSYGIGFFHFDDFGIDMMTLLGIARTATEGVWGRVGIIGIGIGILSLFLGRRVLPLRGLVTALMSDSILMSSLIVSLLFGIAFLRMPFKPAYLMPVIPFFILLLGRILRRPAFMFVCVVIIVSSFVSISASGIVAGPILSDHKARILWMEFTDYVVSLEGELPSKSIVVAGDWLPKLQTRLPLQGQIETPVPTVYTLSEDEAQGYLDEGYRIYYLPGQRIFTGMSDAPEGRVLPLVTDGVEEAYQFMTNRMSGR